MRSRPSLVIVVGPNDPPALLTSRSSFGARAPISAASRPTSDSANRSAVKNSASPPASFARRTTSAPRAASRPTTSTRNPSLASATAADSPSPLVAPVTTAVLRVLISVPPCTQSYGAAGGPQSRLESPSC